MKNNKITFEKLSAKYEKTLYKWFTEDHVKEYYYGKGLKSTLNNVNLFLSGKNNNGDYTFFHWIALLDNKPFGFLMTSPIEGPYNPDSPYDKWYKEDKKIFTLDLLIGDTNFLGKGLATKMIQEFILDKYNDADYFLIDPAERNSIAVHVYQKAGFRKVDEFIPFYDPGNHFIMLLDVGKLVHGQRQ